MNYMDCMTEFSINHWIRKSVINHELYGWHDRILNQSTIELENQL